MTVFKLNKHSHMPLYRQLSGRIISRIQQGELKPGEQIPSEREMAELFGVSRTTARLAIDDLVSGGVVYREQGKGTFVAEPRMSSVMGFTSFSEDMRARGHEPRSRILAQELVTADERLRKELKLGPDEKAIYLRRLRLADERPVAIQTAYLPQAMFPELQSMALADRSLFSILRSEYYIYPAWTEAAMEAAAATEEQAELLNLAPADPVLVVRGLTYTETFEIVESVETVYRGQGLALYIGRQRINSGD